MKKSKTITDVNNKVLVLSKEEQELIVQMEKDIEALVLENYPKDGSQDYIDKHIYGDIRDIAEKVEEIIEANHNTIVVLA